MGKGAEFIYNPEPSHSADEWSPRSVAVALRVAGRRGSLCNREACLAKRSCEDASLLTNGLSSLRLIITTIAEWLPCDLPPADYYGKNTHTASSGLVLGCARAVLCCGSVCVRLSAAKQQSVESWKQNHTIDNSGTLVFWRQRSRRNFTTGAPTTRFSTNISLYLRNRAR